VNLELQAEPVAMEAQVELQVLAGQLVVRLARLGPTALWEMGATQAMVATAAQVLTELREPLE
jgi:hypothetical protein